MTDPPLVIPTRVADSAAELAEMLGAGVAPKVNPNPLQRPGGDRLIRRSEVGGLEQPADRWFIVDSRTLERMLEIARASPTGQMRIPRCGVQVDTCQRRDGTQYEVWRLIGGQPEPEPLPNVIKALAGGGTIR